MNNSEKQAAAFEPKWTCEELKLRQTLTATSETAGTQSDQSSFSNLKKHTDVCACVCDESQKGRRSQEWPPHSIPAFVIPSSSEPENQNGDAADGACLVAPAATPALAPQHVSPPFTPLHPPFYHSSLTLSVH